MWTKAHRARHAASRKEMVSTCAVEATARWLERAGDAGVAGGQRDRLAPAGRWKLAGAAVWLSSVADRVGLVPTLAGARVFDRLLCDLARLRRRSGGRRAEPRLGIIDAQLVKVERDPEQKGCAVL